jgi:hypothetical protein
VDESDAPAAGPIGPTGEELSALGGSIVSAAAGADVRLRLIGGIAVAMHSDTKPVPALRRTPGDIDLVVPKAGRGKLDELFATAALSPDRKFNALHGAERRIYHGDRGIKADVFIGEFRMCHVIPIGDARLELDFPTAPLAELLLTKAQVVQLTHKDIIDVIAIVRDHDIGEHDDGTINGAWIAELSARDWGLWRTLMQTFERVQAFLPGVDMDDEARERVAQRISTLGDTLETTPKSRKWKLRDRIGDRVAWYELPEDPERADPNTPGPLAGQG